MNLILKNKWIIFLIFLALPGIAAFFHPGFFPSHDGEWMVVRFSDFHRSLMDGQFPVRWAGRLNFGYGYPVFNFLYPGTFYFAEIFHLLKFNFVDSIKLVFVTSFILSGVFMYLFAKELWGKVGGLVSAVLYLYTPYRFVDMYVRGSLGESVAFMFPPLIFLAITKLNSSVIASLSLPKAKQSMKGLPRRYAPRNDKVWICLGALGLAGLITAHNVIAYLFLPIICLYILISKRQITNNLITVFLGLGLSAFFWIPALWDKQYTVFDLVTISDFSKNFPSLKELIIPSWGYGPSNPGNPDAMSFQIGIVNILILLFVIIRKNIKNIFWILVTLIAIFFMTSYSKSLWQYIPGLTLIQFPWRILAAVTFLSAVLAGAVRNKYLRIVIIIMAIAFNFLYLCPSGFVNRGEGYYYTNDDTTTVQNEYLPRQAKNLPRTSAEQKVDIIEGEGKIENIVSNSKITKFTYTGTKGQIKINTVFFPGWDVFINNKKQDITVDKNGLINFETENGKNQIRVVFTETPIRIIADIISLLSLLGLLFI